MSEFTNFMQLFTDAQSLAVLEERLLGSVGAAVVPLLELGVVMQGDPALYEEAWSRLAHPRWVMMLTDADLEDLARLGPAYHLSVEEDFQSWSLRLVADGQSWSFLFLRQPDVYREVTRIYPDAVVYEAGIHAGAVSAMAAIFGVTGPELSATFIADGGQSFSGLIGATYEQMMDLNLLGMDAGKVRFGLVD